jgi:AraC-like DNA-binding protein
LAEKARARAAELQHWYVLRIRERMVARDLSVKQYAAEAGMSYYRLARLLRGEVILRLEDIAMADLILGEVSEAARVAAERDRTRRAEARQREEAIAAQAVQAMRQRQNAQLLARGSAREH